MLRPGREGKDRLARYQPDRVFEWSDCQGRDRQNGLWRRPLCLDVQRGRLVQRRDDRKQQQTGQRIRLMLVRYGGTRRHDGAESREADQRCQACQDESPESHASPSIADFSTCGAGLYPASGFVTHAHGASAASSVDSKSARRLKIRPTSCEQPCSPCRLWLQMDKDWQARFEASEKRPRSIVTHLYVLDMLGYVGLAIELVILALLYFKKAGE